jgi:hypothetical protein
MSINVGELVATMRLDDASFTQAIRGAPAEAARGMAGVTSAVSGAAANTSGLWQDAAGKWRNATGQFASTVERQMAGIPPAAGQAGQRAGEALGRGAQDGVNQSRGFFGRLGADLGEEFIGGIKKMIAAAGVIAGGKALLGFFKDSIDAAGDFNETVSMAGAIFGKSFGKVEEWSKTAATALGLSQAAALEAAAGFGDMFLQLGFTGDAAADMSTGTVQLAADLGSFKNLETGDVLDRIGGALRGEYDSLQAVIPNINAARVEHEALAASGKSAASELTAAEKATAVLAIVAADGSRAVGDLAKTSDGAAGTSKRLASQFEDLQVSIGLKLMPAWQAFQSLLGAGIGILGGLVSVVADVVSWFAQLPGPVQAGAIAFAAWVTVGPQVVGFLRGLLFVIPLILTSVGGLAAGFRAAGAAMLTAFGGPIGLAILGVTAAIGIFMARTSDAETTVSNFAGAIDEATGKLSANADEVIRNGAAEAGHLQAYKAIGGAVTDYTGALKGLGPEQDRVHTAILDAAEAALKQSGAWGRMVAKGLELSTNSRQVASDILAAGDAGQYSSDQFNAVLGVSTNLAGDMKVLADQSGTVAIKLEEAGAGAEGAGAKVEEATPPMDNLAAATKEMGSAASGAEVATKFLLAAINELNGGSVTAQQAADLTAAAFRGIGQSQRDAQTAQMDLTQANMDYAAAAANLAAVLANGESTQDQITAAQLANDAALIKVKDSEDAVAQSSADMYDAGVKARDAALAQAGAAVELALRHGDVSGAAAAAASAIDTAKTAFINAQSPTDIESGKAQNLADQLFGIPKDVAIKLAESGATAVQNAAKQTTTDVGNVPRGPITTTFAVDAPRSTVNDYIQLLNSTPPKKTTIMETIIQGAPKPGHLGGALAGYAGGGATRSTGPFTVDSQLAVVHRGEHMLDAGDVSRLGGQNATYGFRDAMAAGGAQAAAMWLLQRNGGLPGAMAPATGPVTVAGNSGPRTVIQFGDVRVGEYRDANDLINRAAYMGIN